MRRFDFTDEQLRAIAHDRFHHVDPRVQQRMEILWLKSQGETHSRIAELAAVSRRTERLTGVCRRPTQVRQFLRTTLGLKWRKVAAIPVPPKKSVAEHAATQAAFLKDRA